ncbi:hypothetical protein [Pontibacter vulgaris]|uniref:hypothetical protein n=1 Tax=Pontibacter vulgaris TaxID=2905679 RepID=UPI001FA7C983|nr:hypothetical protein [Pontibacter vulgaris]
MIVFQNQNFSINISEEKSLLQLTWLKVVSSEQFKAGFRKAVNFAIHYQVKYWVSDNRIGTELDLSTQRWLAEFATENLPQTSLEKFARIIPLDAFVHFVSYKVNDRISQKRAEAFSFEVFTDMDQATYWLFENNQMSISA